MATPIIQKINAFNAGEGTEIRFNIVGSTNIIRSSKVTIYNSSNEKICTHIYNSTQLIHVLPGNNAPATATNPAIIYETGKSASDFVNGYSYSIELEAYTTVNATGDGVGVSSRVQFWCLESPVVQFVNPSSDIEIATSSYSFSANCTIIYPSGVVVPISNRVQSYRFDLYKGTQISSVFVDSSGEMYGTGVDQGNNVYALEYTFSNLDNGSNYYVILHIITEQGMNIVATSNIITISLEDISFSVAQVRNNACNGCVEIVSNITNIIGNTNADFVAGSGHIDLSESSDYYIVWGEDEDYVLNFPIISTSFGSTIRWSMIIKANKFRPSASNPFVEGDKTYFLYLTNTVGSNGIYVYMRQDEDSVFAELYASENFGSSNVSFVTSNVLNNISENDDIYMLIRCYDGWYDIELATELPSE